MEHKELVSKAEKAITALFGDTSVSPYKTKNSLECLLIFIQELIEALEADEAE